MNTPDTEWEKELRKEIQMFFYNAEHPEVYSSYEIAMFERKVEGIISIFQNTVSSRDTYWKERIRKEVEKLNLRVNQITDGTGVTPVQRGGTSHGHYQAHGEVMGLKKGVRALDTLLDNLK